MSARSEVTVESIQVDDAGRVVEVRGWVTVGGERQYVRLHGFLNEDER